MTTDKKFSDTLVLLISNCNVMQERDLDEALMDAEVMEIPIEEAISLSGKAKPDQLKTALQAREMVQKGQITVDTAVAAMRLVGHQAMSLENAVNAVRALETAKQPPPPPLIQSGIGQLLADAGVISNELLQRACERAQQTQVTPGRILRMNRDVTPLILNSAIDGCMLLRDKKVTHEQTVDALKMANKRQISIEQALFEQGNYVQPGDNELKLSDLFSMAALISETDRLECLELELVRNQPLGQILTSQGLVTHETLETAVHLQGSVANDAVRAYQAADALRRVAVERVSVYQVLAELRSLPQTPPMRLGDMLVAATFATFDQIEQAITQSQGTNVKIGKVLLQAGIISEPKLFNSLRCQSLARFGFLSDTQAVAALRHTDRNSCTLEDAFNSFNVYAPSSMQWSWV